MSIFCLNFTSLNITTKCMLKSKPKQSEQILRQFGITFLSDIRTRLNILAKKACYLSRNLTVAIDAEDNRGCKGWLIKMVLLKMRCFVLKKKSFPHFDVLHWDCLFVFVFYLFTHISTVLFANFEHMLQIKLNLVLSFLL